MEINCITNIYRVSRLSIYQILAGEMLYAKQQKLNLNTVVPLYTAPSPTATPLIRPQYAGTDSSVSLITPHQRPPL